MSLRVAALQLEFELQKIVKVYFIFIYIFIYIYKYNLNFEYEGKDKYELQRLQRCNGKVKILNIMHLLPSYPDGGIGKLGVYRLESRSLQA